MAVIIDNNLINQTLAKGVQASGKVQASSKETASSEAVNFKSVLKEELAVPTAASDDISASKGSSSTVNLDDIFEKAASTYGVPVKLLKAMAKAESNFNVKEVSSTGAKGIMQLMPSTAAALGVSDPFDPEQNIMGGAKYISSKLKQYNGNLKLALAAYQAGSGNVKKYGGVPPFKSTQTYIKNIYNYMGQNITASKVTVDGNNTVLDSLPAFAANSPNIKKTNNNITNATANATDSSPSNAMDMLMATYRSLTGTGYYDNYLMLKAVSGKDESGGYMELLNQYNKYTMLKIASALTDTDFDDKNKG